MILPFQELDGDGFEEFVFEFLNSGIELDVLEVARARRSKSRRKPKLTLVRRRIVKVDKHGGHGHAQQGVDYLATMENGDIWAFECKNRKQVGLAKAREYLTKAKREFRSAVRYFIIVRRDPTPTVQEWFRSQANAEIWGGGTLTRRFMDLTPAAKRAEIVARCFPVSGASLVRRLFPLRDEILISADAFFEVRLRAEQLFHHRSEFIGQKDTRAKLDAFVQDPNLRVCLLVAPGGRGKSRQLRAFAEKFEISHPGKSLWFVNPAAPPGARPESIRSAADGTVVVVIDDAHRLEVVRDDLLQNLKERSAKLILAGRPQAVAAIQQRVIEAGFSSTELQEPIVLPKLPRADLEDLARSDLGPKYAGWAHHLAELASDCPLIVVVGAALIRRGDFNLRNFEQADFAREAFSRFEGQELDHVAQGENVETLRRVLKSIALLAPWDERVPKPEEVATLSGCDVMAVHSSIERLENAGIAVKTGKGWRITPDLFADHLVFAACFDKTGQPTRFAKSAQKQFSGTAQAPLLRNIAEAEWLARQHFKGSGSVLRPFFDAVVERFKSADFFARGEIIKDWAAFAIFQPEFALSLARLAVDLKHAPPPQPEYAGLLDDETGASFNRHEHVLARIPTLLEPIAIYFDEHRSSCLGMLWDLSKRLTKTDDPENNRSHPIATIARIGSFGKERRVTDVEAVFAWIEQRFAVRDTDAFLNKRTTDLGVLLKPYFARSVESTTQVGRQIRISNLAVDVRSTGPLRMRVLQLLRTQVLPLGEIAIHNALPVLEVAIENFPAHFGVRWSADQIAAWREERLAALEIINDLVEHQPSGRVLWRIRSMLRAAAKRPDDSIVAKRTQEIASSIKETHELREAIAFMSYPGNEFPAESRQELGSDRWYEEMNRHWDDLLRQVAEHISLVCVGNDVTEYLEERIKIYRANGFTPNLNGVLSAIRRFSLTLAQHTVDAILSRAHTSLDKFWLELIAGSIRLPDPWLEKRMIDVLGGENVDRVGAILNFLKSAGSGTPSTELDLALERWMGAARGAHADLVINLVSDHWSKDDRLWNLATMHLAPSELTAPQIQQLCSAIVHAGESGNCSVPDGLLVQTLKELVRVEIPDLGNFDQFVSIAQDRHARPTYEMLFARVEETVKLGRAHRPRFHPFPRSGDWDLVNFPKDHSFRDSAQDLLRTIQDADDESAYWWMRLFQAAVLRVSTAVGIELLSDWCVAATKVNELERIISVIHFPGSLIVVNFPHFTKQMLGKAREIAPDEADKIRRWLAGTAGPGGRGYTNGKVDPEYDYLSAEAVAASTRHADDAELADFFRYIVQRESEDAAWMARRHAMETLDE